MKIPVDIQYCSDKEYYDIVYAYLNLNNTANYSQIGRDLDLSRQTAAKAVKHLIDVGLIEYDKKSYKFIALAANYIEVNDDIIKQLLSLKERHIVSLYGYLCQMLQKNDFKNCFLNLTNIKEFLGITTKTRTNNFVVTEKFKFFKDQALAQINILTFETKGNLMSVYCLKDIKM